VRFGLSTVILKWCEPMDRTRGLNPIPRQMQKKLEQVLAKNDSVRSTDMSHSGQLPTHTQRCGLNPHSAAALCMRCGVGAGGEVRWCGAVWTNQLLNYWFGLDSQIRLVLNGVVWIRRGFRPILRLNAAVDVPNLKYFC
jgi:hypothetical protein